jgi:hypothetical protein
MNTNIFFAFDRQIPRTILDELKQIGAESKQVGYDEVLEEEFCYLKIQNKGSLIKVMHYLHNLKDYHFKYFYPVKSS